MKLTQVLAAASITLFSLSSVAADKNQMDAPSIKKTTKQTTSTSTGDDKDGCRTGCRRGHIRI